MEKRKVTMTNYGIAPVEEGKPEVVVAHQAVDYVPTEILEAYVADAKTRWQQVEVGEEHDAGPGGDEGETHHPEHLKLGITLQDHLGGEN